MSEIFETPHNEPSRHEELTAEQTLEVLCSKEFNEAWNNAHNTPGVFDGLEETFNSVAQKLAAEGELFNPDGSMDCYFPEGTPEHTRYIEDK